MNEDVNQVFNDSAMPSPDLEMLNTLRGTGIQVELREVRMVMIVFKWCLALEGDHGRPYWRWHLWLRTPGRKISILSSTQQSILLEKKHQLWIIIGGSGWTSCCRKPQASGQRYSHDCWCELADLSIKLQLVVADIVFIYEPLPSLKTNCRPQLSSQSRILSMCSDRAISLGCSSLKLWVGFKWNITGSIIVISVFFKGVLWRPALAF